MARTINDIVSEAIISYRQAQDLFNTGDIERDDYLSIVQSVYEVCIEAFENLKQCESEHNFQRTRVINIASEIITKTDPSWSCA